MKMTQDGWAIYITRTYAKFVSKTNAGSFAIPAQPYPSNLVDLIHSDVCGPMENEPFGQAKYFIAFKDDL